MKVLSRILTVMFALAVALPSISHGDNSGHIEASRPTFVLVHGTFQWRGSYNRGL